MAQHRRKRRMVLSHRHDAMALCWLLWMWKDSKRKKEKESRNVCVDIFMSCLQTYGHWHSFTIWEREEGERIIWETSKFHTPAHVPFETEPLEKNQTDTVACRCRPKSRPCCFLPPEWLATGSTCTVNLKETDTKVDLKKHTVWRCLSLFVQTSLGWVGTWVVSAWISKTYQLRREFAHEGVLCSPALECFVADINPSKGPAFVPRLAWSMAESHGPVLDITQFNRDFGRHRQNTQISLLESN